MTAFNLTASANTFSGTSGADSFSGPGGGSDTLNGAGGDDTFDIDANQIGTIDGGANSDTLTAHDNELNSGLSIVNVETLVATTTNLYATAAQLSGFSTITPGAGGTNFYLFLQGAGGTLDLSTRFVSPVLLQVEASLVSSAVTLTGTGNDDFIIGSGFDDHLSGLAGADQISAGAGVDVLDGGLGNDQLDGGSGNDTASFASINQAVVVDLTAGTATGQGNDTLTSIENVIGSSLADTITGTTGANQIDGGGGADIINGHGGNDVLNGGAGNDSFDIDSTQTGTIDGGANSDTLTDHDNELNSGLSIANVETLVATTTNLYATVAQLSGFSTITPGAGGSNFYLFLQGAGGTLDLSTRFVSPVLLQVEASLVSSAVTLTGTANDDFIIGSGFNDQLSGLAGADQISAGAGNDVLDGGANDDTLDGGGGTDTAVFSGSRAAYTITHAGATTTVSGPDGTDTLTSIEKLQFADVTVPLLPAADFNGDGRSDVLFTQPGVNFDSDYQWQMNDRAISGQGGVDLFDKAFSVQVTGDFNGDSRADVLFENPTTGGVWEWQLNGTTVSSQGAVDVGATDYHILGTADFNGDGMSDVLWRSDSGLLYQWQMNGTHDTGAALGTLDPSVWHAVGAGDFTGDGKADILFHFQNGANAADPANGAFDIWQMNGSTVVATLGVERPDASWKILGVGDFNGDGISDIAIRNVSATPDNGAVWVYLMKGTITTHPDTSKTADILAQGAAGIADAATWHVQEIGDLNGDGKDDILFRNDAGYFYSWDMNGTTIASESLAGTQAGNWADPSLHVVGQHWELV